MGLRMLRKSVCRVVLGFALLWSAAAFSQAASDLLARGLPAIRLYCQQLVDGAERPDQDDSDARVALHGLCVEARKGPAGRMVETALLETLAVAKGAELRNFLLEQLYLVASEASLPSLLPLLSAPEFHDAALRVLLGLDTARERVAAEMLRLFPALTGDCRNAVVQALGELGAAAAAPALLPDALGEDRLPRQVAMTALARMNNPASEQAFAALLLRRAQLGAYDAAIFDTAYADYLSNLAAWGRGSEACQLASAWAENGSSAVQNMALAVYERTDSAEARAKLLAGLKSTALTVRLQAARLLRQAQYAVLASDAAAMLDPAQPEVAAQILPLLAFWDNAAALPVVEKAMEWEDEGLRAAAVGTAVALLGEEALPRLQNLLADGRSGVAAAAQRAVVALSQPVGAALAKLTLATPMTQRPALLDILRQRRESAHIAELAILAQDGDLATRQALCQLYGVLCTPEQLSFLFAQIVAAGAAADKDWLNAAERACVQACRRLADPVACMALLRQSYEKSEELAQAALLRVAAVPANDDAMALLRTAWQAGHDSIRDAALRVVADWPSAAALPFLRPIAQAEDSQALWQILAFRGCVRLIPRQAIGRQEQLSELLAMLPLARRIDEKRLVIGAVGSIEDGAAFAPLSELLSDEALQRDAALAILTLSEKLRSSECIRPLRAAWPLFREGKERERAKACMDLLSKTLGRVLLWQAAGPYREDGKNFIALHDIAFAPEKPAQADSVTWQEARADDQGRLDLRKVFGRDSHQVTCYVRCLVKVPETQAAVLFLGSDDGAKVWCNGALVGEKNVPRSYTVDEDKMPLTLRAGDNMLLIKVGQGGGDWCVGAALRAEDGGPLADLKLALP
jgi:HEAT repeat protein